MSSGLLDHRIIVLPADITADTYTMLAETLILRQHQPITMLCAGDGGDSDAAVRIIDLICAHGAVTGILPGGAYSSHAAIFAACGKRYVYPKARFGVHAIALAGAPARVDAKYARQLANDMDATNRVFITVMAEACSEHPWRSVKHWERNVFREAGSGSYKLFGSEHLVSMLGMARPIAELPRLTQKEAADE